MIWPPLKAWTSLAAIEDQNHFVAIKYGGKSTNRWVILMSVIDSSVVIKVAWSKLVDSPNWECGWNEINKSSFNNDYIKTTQCTNPSNDSGLTIPITKNTIRPWFQKN